MFNTPKLFLVIIFMLVGVTSALYSNHLKFLPDINVSAGGGLRDTLNPEIVIEPDSFYVVIKPDTVLQFQMVIFNEGNDTLEFSIDNNAQFYNPVPALDRSVEGSTLTSDITSYIPGETIDYAFSLFNGSPDNEWLDTLVVHMPEGVSLNFSTNFTGGSLGPLVFDGNTGTAVTASWNDENGGGGNIVPGETAIALLNLSFDEALDDTLLIPYEISGDVFGSAPHVIYDTLILAPKNIWLITGPESGTVPPGGQLNIDLYFNSGGIPIGYYDRFFSVETNDTSNLIYDIPVTLIVFPYNLTHTLTIPEGWSGISTYVLPFFPEIEDIFDTLSNQIEVLRDQNNIFWPGQQINTIGEWNTYEGYIINASEQIQVNIPGIFEVSQTIFLQEGWHIMPVLTTQVSSTFVVFRDVEDLIDIVMEVAGDKVYWPSQNIYTLTQLHPGKAYYIRVTGDCSIHFPSPVE
ncbi:MAG: hypothetical protein B6D64_01665 [Bacteroidetes bacterium 4484_276]|nr:MAG: hypothetical protein B6D64_01665 [Bacteroidetes bacterium 4484_276]